MAQDVPPPSFGGAAGSAAARAAGPGSTRGNTLAIVLVTVFAIYVVISAYLLYGMHNNIAELQKTAAEQGSREQQLTARMNEAEARTRAANEALADKLGITAKELDQRSAELQRQQRAAEARITKQQQEQIQSVSGQVQNVQQDVSATKTDLSATKTDLADTKAKLESMRGDLGVQSGLIARTRDDLETLKKRGERNYFEFTLLKSKRPTVVSTISLQLKKVDVKRSKYTMNVFSDDRTIEKKDKNMGEPVQFYSGRGRQLYELVVFEIAKDRVSGYLSTPKQQ